MNSSEPKTFLVTGATGFAGPHLMNLLIERGHSVIGLTRRTNGMQTDILDVVPQENYEKIEWAIADITDRDSLNQIFSKRKIDGVFHLAAMSLPTQSFIDPVGTFRDNVMGTVNLIDVIEKTQGNACKLMFCSSSEVYGNAGSDGRLIKETEALAPSNPYGTTKACMDLYMQERMANGKINGFITRAFSHTGPRRGMNFSISSDAYQIAKFIVDKKNSPIFPAPDLEYILKVGNLQTTRVVMDIRDCCMAYYLLMLNESSSGQAFNVCGNIPRKMEYFTDELIRISTLSIKKVIHKPFFREHDISYQHGDTEKLKALTGWKEKIFTEYTLLSLLGYWVDKTNKIRKLDQPKNNP